MADTNNFFTCTAEDGDPLLPSSPFTALNYHYGMLLGVDDLETEQSYHRGKRRLHNAWQHGEGVAWGFGVEFRKEGNGNPTAEIMVSPGLALDAAGRELHLAVPHCVDLGLWYEKHKDEAEYGFVPSEDGRITFSLYITARFKSCLFRAVPAIAETCAGASTDTAYSRTYETVELLIRSQQWLDIRNGKRPKITYPRLHLLFGLDSAFSPEDLDKPEYQEVLARSAAIRAKPPSEWPDDLVDAFREFSALDTMEMKPQQDGDSLSLFPEDPTELVLARLEGAQVTKNAEGRWALAQWPKISFSVRPVLVAVSALQELLCGSPFLPSSPDAIGPRVLPETAKLEDDGQNYSFSFSVDKPLHPQSITPGAFSLSYFIPGEGWQPGPEINPVLDDQSTSIRLTWGKPDLNGGIIRLRALGTGSAPLLGASPNLLPLAGAAGNLPSDPHAGADFVFQGS